MKKIMSVVMIMIVCGATVQAQNTKPPATNPYDKPGDSPVSPVKTIKTNSNSMYDNNSQQYNKGNTIKNPVPSASGTYETPGSQGMNNNANPSFNNNNTPGTLNNNGANGTYAQPVQPGSIQR